MQKTNLGTARSGAVAFTIGNKGYLGTGYLYSAIWHLADFWEYDPSNDSWTQKANFGGGTRSYAVGFSIGNFGYAGTGEDWNFNSHNDFWKYDPVANIWTQVASVSSNLRKQATGFAIGGKGYIGTGWDGNIHFNDFWEYDPGNNTWTQKPNFSGTVRRDIDRAVFVIGNMAYTCGGYDGTNLYNDVWQYDQNTNAWTQKAILPGITRRGAVGFSLCGYGFIGTGLNGFTAMADFYMYNPNLNSWSVAPVFPDSACWDAQSFVINNKAYVMTGNHVDYWSGEPRAMQDLWEFSEPPINPNVSPDITSCTGSSVILSASGGINYLWNTGETTNSILVSPTSTTTYLVTISSAFCYAQSLNTTVFVINSANSLFTYSYDPCKNNCVQFTDASTNALSWCWNTGDGGSSSNQDPCWQYPVTATYNPALIVNCNTACADTFSVSIPYEIHDTASVLYIPNAFSPNGDGENDVLRFYIQDDYCVKEFEITIYDRWGEKVYETTNLSDSWDGSFNGKKLHTEMFVYYCKTISATGIITTRKGNINLLW